LLEDEKLTTSGVVVEVALDVAANDTPQRPDEIVDLPRIGATHGVGYTDTVEADLVYGPVDGEEVDQLGSERVLGGESDFDSLGLDELDDLDGAVFGTIEKIHQNERGCKRGFFFLVGPYATSRQLTTW
jgi:hypothetical protein